MNIFVLDENPEIAARMYCDKHVPKMVVEMLQQLGSAVIRHGATPDMMPLTKKGTPLKGGYHNHPCTRWVGETRGNFHWAHRHAMELCREYRKRFGKTHFCEAGIIKLKDMMNLLPNVYSLTEFAQAMPDIHKHPHAVVAYRSYYHDKSFAKWEKGPNPAPPYWWGGAS